MSGRASREAQPGPAHPLDGYLRDLLRFAANPSTNSAVLEIRYNLQSDAFTGRIRY